MAYKTLVMRLIGRRPISISAITGTLDKAQLPPWYGRMAGQRAAVLVRALASSSHLLASRLMYSAELGVPDEVMAAALRLLDKGSAGTKADADRVSRWVASAAEDVSGQGRERGKWIHSQAEARAADLPPPTGAPPELAGLLEAFDAAWDALDPEVLACEGEVYNDQEDYGGRLDLMVRPREGRLAGKTLILDTKSGGGVYGDVALQMVGYKRATTLITEDAGGLLSAVPMPPVDECAVLHLSAGEDGQAPAWRLIPIATEEPEWRAFLALRDAALWRKSRSPAAVREAEAFGGIVVSAAEEPPASGDGSSSSSATSSEAPARAAPEPGAAS